MDHCTIFEIHAIATLTTNVSPVYYPGMKYMEEGAHIVTDGNKPLIMVSPDGRIGHLDVNAPFENPDSLLRCEFKAAPLVSSNSF